MVYVNSFINLTFKTLEELAMENQIKNFLAFLENEKKVAKNTLQSYERDILQFEAYLNSQNLFLC